MVPRLLMDSKSWPLARLDVHFAHKLREAIHVDGVYLEAIMIFPGY